LFAYLKNTDANGKKQSLTWYYIFYLISYFSIGMPMLGWFGVQIQYLLAYSEGNSSGMVV